MLSTETELYTLCKSFVDEHVITCPESIHQTDRVIVDAYSLIEKICDIVGYVETED